MRLYVFGLVTMLLDMSVGSLGNRAVSIFLVGNPSSTLSFFFSTFLASFANHSAILALLRKFSATSFSANLAMGTLKEGASTYFAAAASTL